MSMLKYGIPYLINRKQNEGTYRHPGLSVFFQYFGDDVLDFGPCGDDFIIITLDGKGLKVSIMLNECGEFIEGKRELIISHQNKMVKFFVNNNKLVFLDEVGNIYVFIDYKLIYLFTTRKIVNVGFSDDEICFLDDHGQLEFYDTKAKELIIEEEESKRKVAGIFNVLDNYNDFYILFEDGKLYSYFRQIFYFVTSLKGDPYTIKLLRIQRLTMAYLEKGKIHIQTWKGSKTLKYDNIIDSNFYSFITADSKLHYFDTDKIGKIRTQMIDISRFKEGHYCHGDFILMRS